MLGATLFCRTLYMDNLVIVSAERLKYHYYDYKTVIFDIYLLTYMLHKHLSASFHTSPLSLKSKSSTQLDISIGARANPGS